jgi:hypothetical protein
MRDEKMLKKLATCNNQDVMEHFSLADKCARNTEGHAWHTHQPQRRGRVASLMQARLTVTTSCWLELPLPQQLLPWQEEPEVPEVISSPIKRPTAMMEAHVA